MKTKLYNFFDSPWVAFPLTIVALILFLWLGMKVAAYSERRAQAAEVANGR